MSVLAKDRGKNFIMVVFAEWNTTNKICMRYVSEIRVCNTNFHKIETEKFRLKLLFSGLVGELYLHIYMSTKIFKTLSTLEDSVCVAHTRNYQVGTM